MKTSEGSLTVNVSLKRLALWAFLAGIPFAVWFLHSPEHRAWLAGVPSPSKPAAATTDVAAPAATPTISITIPEALPTSSCPPGGDGVTATALPRSAATSKPSKASRSTPSKIILKITATNGSIVFVGANGHLTANTGSVSNGGLIAIDIHHSTISTGAVTQTGSAGAAATAVSPDPTAADAAASSAADSEDDPVSLVGNDQIATNDDSNVFLGRNGPINTNTGDTDSSGLNAVDVAGSTVRTGASTGASTGAASGSGGGALAAPVIAPPGSPTATAGGGVRSTGNRNIVTSDDSNLVVGGSGKVNAQAGDSDTGGAVVMGITQSDIATGGSS